MLTTKAITRAGPSAGASIDFSGTWTNQVGSTMVLAMAGQKITGRYRSPVSGGGGSVDGDIVGWAEGDLISFIVNWDTSASLTAWSGQLAAEGGRDVIKTLWLLVQNVPDANEPTGLWQSTLAGADEFWRV